MFSATIPENIEKLAKLSLNDHIRIRVWNDDDNDDISEPDYIDDQTCNFSTTKGVIEIPVKQTGWKTNQKRNNYSRY